MFNSVNCIKNGIKCNHKYWLEFTVTEITMSSGFAGTHCITGSIRYKNMQNIQNYYSAKYTILVYWIVFTHGCLNSFSVSTMPHLSSSELVI